MRNPFRRREPETRSIDTLPWNYGGVLGEATVDQTKALSLAPVYSAVRIIAQDLSTLPLKAYRKVADERVPMTGLPQLFSLLVDAGRLQPWLFRCVTSLALRGNAYGLIVQRDGFGFPTVIEWLNPSEVTVNDQSGVPEWYWRGRPVPTEDMFHIPWFALPGQTLGLSPISAFAVTINAGLHGQAYANDWFEGGGVAVGTFKNTEQEVPQDAANAIKARLGNAIRTRETIVYGKDWDYSPISVAPKDAQMVEAQNMTANLIAGIYGVRPEKIGGVAGSSLTYATVEQNQLEYTTSTLRFWAELLEGHFFGQLPSRQYVKFNLDAIVRPDLKTRWEVHEIRRRIGAASIDEIRKLEDEPPLPNGEGQDYTPIMPGAAIPVPAVADQGPPPPNVVPIRADERPVHVTVSPPDVRVNVEPADVQVVMPEPGTRTRTVERDADNNIVRIVEA